MEENAEDSHELSNIPDWRIFNDKIQKLIRENRDLQPKTPFSPITNVICTISLAEYLDTYDTHNAKLLTKDRFSLMSFHMKQRIEIQLGPRLVGDIGFLVYTKQGLGVFAVTPRIEWTYGAGYKIGAGAQIGDRTGGSVSLQRNWERRVLELSLSKGPGGVIGLLMFRYFFSATADGKIQVELGENGLFAVKGKKKLNNGHVIGKGKLNTREIEIGGGYSRQVFSNVLLKGYLGLNGKGSSIGLRSSIGISIDIRPYTKLSYSLEVLHNDVLLRTKLSKGPFNLNVPFYLTHRLSEGPIFLGIALFGLLLYATRSFFASDSSENSLPIEARAESKKTAVEYRLLISVKAAEIRDAEQSGNGLVILSAYYGASRLVELVQRGGELVDEPEELFEVTVPLQFLTSNSALFLSSGSKSLLNGFFNPVLDPTESPVLYVKYSHNNEISFKVCKDDEIVIVP